MSWTDRCACGHNRGVHVRREIALARDPEDCGQCTADENRSESPGFGPCRCQWFSPEASA